MSVLLFVTAVQGGMWTRPTTISTITTTITVYAQGLGTTLGRTPCILLLHMHVGRGLGFGKVGVGVFGVVLGLLVFLCAFCVVVWVMWSWR